VAQEGIDEEADDARDEDDEGVATAWIRASVTMIVTPFLTPVATMHPVEGKFPME